MDIVDLHFVEDIDSVAKGGAFRGFDNDFEPGRVGAAFFIEEDGADGSLVDGFSDVGVFPFVVVDVVLAEKEGDGAALWLERGSTVGGQVKRHDRWFGHFRAVDKEGNQEETEVDHGGKIDAGGKLFGFGDTAGFARRGGGGDIGHGYMVLR